MTLCARFISIKNDTHPAGARPPPPFLTRSRQRHSIPYTETQNNQALLIPLQNSLPSPFKTIPTKRALVAHCLDVDACAGWLTRPVPYHPRSKTKNNTLFRRRWKLNLIGVPGLFASRTSQHVYTLPKGRNQSLANPTSERPKQRIRINSRLDDFFGRFEQDIRCR